MSFKLGVVLRRPLRRGLALCAVAQGGPRGGPADSPASSSSEVLNHLKKPCVSLAEDVKAGHPLQREPRESGWIKVSPYDKWV